MPAEEQKGQPGKEQPGPAAAEKPPVQQESAEQKKPPAQEKPGAGPAPKAEKQTNCPVCNKPIKRLTRYYRDGKFYCAKKCWRTAKEKAKKEKEPSLKK